MQLRTSRLKAGFLALALAAIPTTAALANPTKDQIASKRAQATAAEAELEALGNKIEPAIEKYNEAASKVKAVQSDITANQAAIGRIRGNLAATQTTLTSRLQAEYRRGDEDPLLIALESGNLADVLEKVTLLKQAERGTADVALELKSSKRELARRKAVLARDRVRAVALQAEAAAQRRAVEQAIAAQKTKLSSLHSDIRFLIAENARQQAALARQAEERLAASSAAARSTGTTLPDPGIGGSGGTPVTPGGSSSGGSSSGGSASGGSSGGSSSGGTSSGGSASGGSSGGTSSGGSASGGSSGGSSSGGSSSGGSASTDGSSGGGSAPAPPSSSGASAAVAAALSQLGVMYQWGASSPGVAFDCSGLPSWAWGRAGVSLDHFTGAQWNEGTHVSRGDLQPGDLVFFSGLGHVGMYIGNGEFVHAPHTGDVVKISSLSGYYDSSYVGAVRPG